MKNTMRRTGNSICRGLSLLLMVSLLISVLPVVSVADTVTAGAYGTCTVTTKNVVIRTTAAGSRTGYFAQKGTYPMIGPVETVDGVEWYNIQTSDTSGYVSSAYATANYGSAGMPSTDAVYVDILYDDITLILGNDPTADTAATATVGGSAANTLKGQVLQLADGDNPYNAIAGTATASASYINVYYNNVVYHARYTDEFKAGIMTQDNLNTYIANVTWEIATAETRSSGAKGDYLTHAIQAALYVMSYYDDDVDGDYGAKTISAVNDFKTDMIANGYSSWTANGIADSVTINKLFSMASDELAYIRSTNGLSGSTGTTTTTTMIQTTVKNLRIRKSYSTSSAYVGKIETSGTILTYTRTHTVGTTTWYYIQYDGTYGWVMGTYVTEYTVSSGTGTTTTNTITNYGTVTITKKLVAIRTSANGSRSGYHVDKGDVCTMIGPAVEAGGYTWYHIRTENGREGYVRGDCATADYGSAGMPDPDNTYVQILYDSIVLTEGSTPASPGAGTATTLKGTVLQLVTGSSYTVSDIAYINVYYNNTIYFTRYNSDFTDGLMTADNTNDYVVNTIWAEGLASTEIAANIENNSAYIRDGDIRVYAIQAALYQLEYMDDSDDYDGTYGSDTEGAVEDFEDDYMTTSNGQINSSESITLFTAAKSALELKLTTDTSTDGDVLSVGDFGTVNTVKLGSWSEIDGGSTSLFPKGSVAYVMSVDTKKVFRVYRWSGANHADCVPYDTSDTAVLASILGFTYNTATDTPTSSELASVIASGDEDYPSYTWPQFRWGGTLHVNKIKIPVWVNLNGTVYCASIYVIPHGFTGDNTSAFTRATLDGSLYHERNNFYGMMCVHFYGSTTHASGKVDATHKTNILYAYNQAASYFGASKVE